MLKQLEAKLARPSQGVRSALTRAGRPIGWATWLFVIIVVVLIVWDVILQRWDPARPNTWSEVARAASYDLPILPWFLGAMVGHLFHGDRTAVIDPDAGATLMGLLWVLMGGWSVFLYRTEAALSITAVAVIAAAGVAVAYWIWPLDRRENWKW